MDYSMGQTGKVPGPIPMSFPETDRQTDRSGPDRQTGQGNKAKWVRGLGPASAAVSGFQIQLCPGDLGDEQGWQGPQFL